MFATHLDFIQHGFPSMTVQQALCLVDDPDNR